MNSRTCRVISSLRHKRWKKNTFGSFSAAIRLSRFCKTSPFPWMLGAVSANCPAESDIAQIRGHESHLRGKSWKVVDSLSSPPPTPPVPEARSVLNNKCTKFLFLFFFESSGESASAEWIIYFDLVGQTIILNAKGFYKWKHFGLSSRCSTIFCQLTT